MLKGLRAVNVCFGKWFSRSLCAVAFVACLVFLTHPGRFARRYDHIPDGEIGAYLVPVRSLDADTCPPFFPNSSKEVENVISSSPYDETELANELSVNLGGWWSPTTCEPVHDVTLVIPYRQRPTQLNIFLRYMHKFLQCQLISYRIILVEQAPGKPFNRGKLMNIGFKEATKLHRSPCFIFHDVDLIPQVMSNIYGCTLRPRHLSASINVWRYNLLYNDAFGGAVAILSDQFQKANGFSNAYFGWGAEDDDFLMRVRRIGLQILRFSPEISRYFMLPHKAEEKNPQRFQILNAGESRSSEDGLNSLEYQVLAYRSAPLYTHVVVQV